VRPVNLIPPEDRRGHHAPARTGRLAPFLVVGGLVAALAGVTAMVLTGNQISDRKTEIAELELKEARLQDRAAALASYIEFNSVREQRTYTAASLADSRFDWERVLRELALVLPADVWLINVTGTAAPGIAPKDSSEIQAREAVSGPALEVVGCAPGQEAVARFAAALGDIDGATRVGVATSERPDLSTDNADDGSTEQDDDCRTRDFISRFEIVVAFDAVPAPGTAPAPAPAPDGATPTAAAAAATDGATAEQTAAREATESQIDKVRNAVHTYTP
jgi:Tfp pilus assembly protein PilN